jgi:putative membrane protein
MRRHVVLAGLAAIAVPALAQQAPVAPIPVTPQPAETQANPTVGGSAQEREERVRQGGAPQDTRARARQGERPAGGPAVSEAQGQAEARLIQDMLATGTVALQTSAFARDKAQNPHVKEFARFEEDEQNTLADVLRTLAAPATTASTGAAQSAATAPELSPQASGVMERLSGTQAGPEFDRAYVAAQIQAHRDLLGSQERYLSGAQPNSDLATVARLVLSRAREHLARLQALEGEVGR